MIKNYELFIDNPIHKFLLNDGVAEVADDFSDEKLKLLRYELQTFVCEMRTRKILFLTIHFYQCGFVFGSGLFVQRIWKVHLPS